MQTAKRNGEVKTWFERIVPVRDGAFSGVVSRRSLDHRVMHHEQLIIEQGDFWKAEEDSMGQEETEVV